jgi:hypothetical protein
MRLIDGAHLSVGLSKEHHIFEAFRVLVSSAAPATTRGSQLGKKRLPAMPIALARLLHARFAHPGRKRIMRALRLFG